MVSSEQEVAALSNLCRVGNGPKSLAGGGRSQFCSRSADNGRPLRVPRFWCCCCCRSPPPGAAAISSISRSRPPPDAPPFAVAAAPPSTDAKRRAFLVCGLVLRGGLVKTEEEDGN